MNLNTISLPCLPKDTTTISIKRRIMMLILNPSSTDWQNQGISGEISRTQLPVA
jgi:hypothetical protein